MKSRYAMFAALAMAMTFGTASSHAADSSDKAKYQPKPNLKVREKPAEKDQRVVPEPGKPEAKQPPPDVVSPSAEKAIPSTTTK